MNQDICGAGPGGLASAIEALKSRHNVTIIEKREKEDTTLRTQLLNPTGNTVRFLQDNVKTDDPIHPKLYLINFHNAVQLGTKDIQRALINKLVEEKSCTFIYSANVSRLDMEKGIIAIQKQGENKGQENTETEIPFDDLVDATGTKHAIANFLKGSGFILHRNVLI